MCGINGIIVKEDEESGRLYNLNISRNNKNLTISDLFLKGMYLLKHRGPDSSGILVDDEVFYFNDFNSENIEEIRKKLNKNNKEKKLFMGHNRLAIVGEANQPIPNENEQIWVICNGEIYNYLELKEIMFNHKFISETDTEIILHCYEEECKFNELDGDYAYCIYDKEKNKIILGRDLIGVKPLYYIDNEKYFAFASEKKCLINLLIEINNLDFDSAYNYNINRLPPNSSLVYDLNDDKYKLWKNIKKITNTPYFNKYKKCNYEIIKKELENTLLNAVHKRIRGIDKVGILFSGGIDSSLITKIALDYMDNVILYVCSTDENKEDLIFAERYANEIGATLKKKIISEKEYEEYLFNVAYAIDELNLMKLGVGIPIYASSKLAKLDGIKVVLSGQGADELFGGYNKYKRMLNEGETKLYNELYNNLLNISHINLERDDHCSMANGVELRVPFLDEQLVSLALSIPIKYKINNNENKIILRDLAKNYLPEYICNRPKKAAQYGSGSEKIIFSVAKKYGYSKKNINKFFKEVLIEKIKHRYLS